MKHNKYPQNKNPNHVADAPPLAVEETTQSKMDFELSPDAVARRAYFCYVNAGSLPGHDVQHWLKAEADLLAERNLTRVHGFHNRT